MERKTKWKTVDLTLEQKAAIKRVLLDYGIHDEVSHVFIPHVFQDLGLLVDPYPAHKTTAREIKQQARHAASGIERQDKLSEIYQRVRGGRVIPTDTQPTGTNKRRRPEPEISRMIQLINWHLRVRCRMKTGKRLACIANLLIETGVDGYAENEVHVVADRIRKRLKRYDEVCESDYTVAVWCAMEDKS